MTEQICGNWRNQLLVIINKKKYKQKQSFTSVIWPPWIILWKDKETRLSSNIKYKSKRHLNMLRLISSAENEKLI